MIAWELGWHSKRISICKVNKQPTEHLLGLGISMGTGYTVGNATKFIQNSPPRFSLNSPLLESFLAQRAECIWCETKVLKSRRGAETGDIKHLGAGGKLCWLNPKP